MKAKIAFFNTYLQGGAAYGAINLFNSLQINAEYDAVFYYMRDISGGSKLNKINHNNSYICKHPLQRNSILTKIPNSFRARKYYKKIQRELLGRVPDFEQFSPSWQYYRTPLEWFSTDTPDIIHLHWIAEWIDYDSFFTSLPPKTKVVWTLHDMNPFTGGCHYSWDCDKYKQECTHCPQLGTSTKSNFALKNWHNKRNAQKDIELHVVGDSNWITEEAKLSPLFSSAKSFRTIHYSIDFSIFKPADDRTEVLKKFNVPVGAFVICFGAADFTNRRKGFPELIDALKFLKRSNVNLHCLVFGSGGFEIDVNELPPIHLTGHLTPSQLAEVYSASDLFVIPSLYEAFGLTAIEAMACGTPVIGFNTGGIPDSVVEGVSGWLVQTGNSVELAQKIADLSSQPEYVASIGRSACEFVKTKFSKDIEFEAYKALYSSIIHDNINR